MLFWQYWLPGTIAAALIVGMVATIGHYNGPGRTEVAIDRNPASTVGGAHIER